MENRVEIKDKNEEREKLEKFIAKIKRQKMNCFNCGAKIPEDNAEATKLFADTGMCQECYEKAMVEMHAAKDPIPVIVIGLVGVLKELVAGINGISDALRDRNS
jgi:hypothetical protein